MEIYKPEIYLRLINNSYQVCVFVPLNPLTETLKFISIDSINHGITDLIYEIDQLTPGQTPILSDYKIIEKHPTLSFTDIHGNPEVQAIVKHPPASSQKKTVRRYDEHDPFA